MSLPGRTTVLRQVIDAVTATRANESQTLILRGDAGSGKSALLEAVLDQLPPDCMTLTAAGHQAESDIGYAGLHQLLGPLIDHVDLLDEPHRSDLRCALSLGYGPAPTRLAVGHAVLMLLSRAAADEPVVALIDDVHWLDRSSLQALIFAARRLDADPVVMVLASRPDEDMLSGFGTTIDVPPLALRQSTELLRTQHPHMSARVADVIARQAGGLPLALVEIPQELTVAQLSGEEPLPDLLPIGPGIERLYANRLSTLTSDDRHALLLASLDDHSADALRDLLKRRGLSLSNLTAAEQMGLVRTTADGSCEFVHPTIRAAVQSLMSSTELAAAHRDVAGQVREDPVRHVFHLHRARSTEAPELEAALVKAAEHLSQRGSGVEAAQSWEAAATLTHDVNSARHYWTRAVESLVRTSDARSLRRIVGRLVDTSTDDVDAARWESLHTAATLWTEGPSPGDIPRLVERGRLLLDRDDDAVDVGLELLHAVMFSLLSSGRAGQAHQIVQIVRESERASDRRTAPQRLLCDAVDVMVGSPGAGAVLRGPWLTELGPDELADPSIPVGYFGSVLVWLGDVEGGAAVIEHLRTSDRVGDIALVAAFSAAVTEALQHTETGDWDRAVLEFRAAETLATDGDFHGALNLLGLWHAVIPAARGDMAECERLRASVRPAGIVSQQHLDGWVNGLSRLSVGDYEQAATIFADVYQLEQDAGVVLSGYTAWFSDWVEARWHLGTADELALQVDELAAIAERTDHVILAARAERCRALLADDFDPVFARSIALHDRSTNRYERARTQLLWGRRLRRNRHRGLAREHLEEALADFASVGADAWVAQTRDELAACGVRTVDGAGVPTVLSALTPREFHVAKEVAAGATNLEAANRLFVSPRTVEFHLSNVYRKLGLTERRELSGLFEPDN